MENIFERATREHLRFESNKGLMTVEDLWDLSLTVLDQIAVGYHKKLRAGDTVSFVTASKKSDDMAQLQFDVVKHVIDVKLEAKAANEAAAKRRENRQRIMEIIASKEDESLKGKSLDELRALLNDQS